MQETFFQKLKKDSQQIHNMEDLKLRKSIKFISQKLLHDLEALRLGIISKNQLSKERIKETIEKLKEIQEYLNN